MGICFVFYNIYRNEFAAADATEHGISSLSWSINQHCKCSLSYVNQPVTWIYGKEIKTLTDAKIFFFFLEMLFLILSCDRIKYLLIDLLIKII